MTDAQLAALYPTVQSYVDKIVAATVANAAAGYIPKDYTRDPAWYTDIRDAVNDNAARIDSGVANQIRLSALRAEDRGGAGDKYAAMLDVDLISQLASSSITNAAARDAVLRPAKAASALLWKAIDAPTSTSVTTTPGGSVPATLGLTLGAPASFGAFVPGADRTYDASSTATVTSTAGDATLSTDGGKLVQRRVHAERAAADHVQQVDAGTRRSPTTASRSPSSSTSSATEPLRTGAYTKTRDVHALDHDPVGASRGLTTLHSTSHVRTANAVRIVQLLREHGAMSRAELVRAVGADQADRHGDREVPARRGRS